MNIIFDAGGVLFYIAEFRNNVIKRVLLSRNYSENLIDKGLTELKDFDKKYLSQNSISDWSSEKIWLELRMERLISMVDPGNRDLYDQLYILAMDSFQYHLFEETVEVLESLKGQYTLYVLSNATATLDWAFDYLDIRKYFKEVFISSYMGYEKPDHNIYKQTLDCIDDGAKSCIFIDDRLENIEAARELGINSYHLVREEGRTLKDFITYIKQCETVEV